VPRFYSPEWVAAFNAAVAGLDAGAVDTSASRAASGGSFRVAQVVHGAPDGDRTVALVVTDGRLSLELEDPAGATAGRPTGGAGPDGRPDVTISLSYEDAAALSRGELDPAEAIGRGRVRVRGDLAVLVAGQALLAAAAPHLADLQAATTY
jgi:hypothetical protein